MLNALTNAPDLKFVTLRLLEYCRDNDWAGYDPYDAVNSAWFKFFPFLNSRLPRLVLTQLLKRSPVNVRPLFLIPKTQNPKALALFLMATLKLWKSGFLESADVAHSLIERLEALRSQDMTYWCWGYSFPWQTRTIVVPRGAPSLVCTTFVANACLDAYECFGEQRHLDMAISSAKYIVDELYWTTDEHAAGFSYPLPSVRADIHNANFLAAALLARVSLHSKEKSFLEPALKAARYSASKQHSDGSWYYGELPKQRWIDNFHTGYNLGGLRALGRYAETDEFESNIKRGFEFYRGHFFREDGAPRYFHDRTYPIDIHCVAQSMITLLEFKDLDPGSVRLAESLYHWVTTNMWNENGYFYYRVLPFCTIKTSYMRWSQAWMLLAVSTFLEDRQLSDSKAVTSPIETRLAV